MLVGVVDAPGDRGAVAARCEHAVALLALHDRGAGVLAPGEDPTRRDRGVLQQVEGHELVVRRRLGIVEDGPQLGEVARPQQVRDVAHGPGGELHEHLGLDAEEALTAELDRVDATKLQPLVRRVVGNGGEQLLEHEFRHGADFRAPDRGGTDGC